MSLIKPAIDCLEPAGNQRSLDCLVSAYTSIVEQWFSAFVASPAEADTHWLYSQVVDTDRCRARRFVLAPDTYYNLSGPWRTQSLPDRSFFASSLAAELALLRRMPGEMRSDAEHLWTAASDYCVSADGSIRYAAPLVHGIVVDGMSPVRHFDYGNIEGDLTDYSSSELALVTQQLDLALNRIQAHAPAAHQLITRNVRSVVVQRREPHDVFIAGSRSSLIGKIGFANVHCASTAQIIESLLHESVHAFLYSLELLEPLFIGDRHSGPVVTSPWTGRLLAVHSYTHACFVWYALARFWAAAKFLDEDAKRLLERARAGFSKGDLTESIAAFVSADVLLGIQEMQAKVEEDRC